MKSLFEGKVFSDEIAFWKYIQTIDAAPTGTADGLYVVEVNSELFQLCYSSEFYYLNRADGIQFFRSRDFTYARASFYILRGILQYRYFDGNEIAAGDVFENGKWVEKWYEDFFLKMPAQYPQFTIEEQQKAAKSLLEHLKVHGKKIS